MPLSTISPEAIEVNVLTYPSRKIYIMPDAVKAAFEQVVTQATVNIQH